MVRFGFSVLNFASAPHSNWVLNKVCKEIIVDERERIALAAVDHPLDETPAEGKGGIDDAAPTIPAFTPVPKDSVDYVDEELDSEETIVEAEPLYKEQPDETIETRRRTAKVCYSLTL